MSLPITFYYGNRGSLKEPWQAHQTKVSSITEDYAIKGHDHHEDNFMAEHC